MVVNFRARKISQDTRKLAQIPILLKKKWGFYKEYTPHCFLLYILGNYVSEGSPKQLCKEID